MAQQVTADWYVSAVPCEKLAAVLTPDVIAADPKLSNVALLRTEWMNGLMFYLRKRVDVTKGHVNFVDSGWAIASISEEQFWKRSMTSYGDGTVKDCLSAIISDWSTPGNFNGRSARDCTPDEIATEAWAQIKAHLNDTDRVVDDAMLHSSFLDPSIIDPGTPTVRNDEPLFIQDPGSWARRPEAVTGIDKPVPGRGVDQDRPERHDDGGCQRGWALRRQRCAAGLWVFRSDGQDRRTVPGAVVGAVQGGRPGATAPGFRTRSTSSTPAGLRVSVSLADS